jgi:hypothetical protein
MDLRMQPRRLQIVDSLLDLDADSLESDTIRMRRAHLARYAKIAMVGGLVICFAAGVRVAIEAAMGDAEIEAASVTASVDAAPRTADTSARPLPTPAAEVLATREVTAIATATRSRSRARGR